MALCIAVLPVVPLAAHPATQGQQPELQVGEWSLSSVVDWQAGEVSGLIITNNAGGELRLDAGVSQGSFTSALFETPFPIHAAGAVWRADVPQGTNVLLELRGFSQPITTTESIDTGADAGAGEAAEWQRLIAGDARSQVNDGAFATPDVLAFPPGTRYLQLRVTLFSEVERASAVLNEVTVAYLNAVQAGPDQPRGLQRVPVIFGPNTLTPRPTLIPRSTWFTEQPIPVYRWENDPQPTQVMTDTWQPGLSASVVARGTPRGIIVHQIDATTEISETLPFLRALGTYQVQVLGWDDMPYHYVIDQEGNLYEGRLGGPTAAVSRLSGGDTAIHVALLGDFDAEPGQAVQGTLVSLLAWLGQAYAISPTGEHAVLAGNNRVLRENIAGHSQVAAEAPDPGESLLNLLPQIRDLADQSTVRARWYFAEGNNQDYDERLVFFNPTETEANANVTLLSGGEASPLLRIVAVPANGRAELVLDEVISDTTTLSAIVESSEAIIAGRSMSLPSDIDTSIGVAQPSRVWYFAEGSTDAPFNTYLVLFNPQVSPTTAEITYMKGDGTLAAQEVNLPPSQRVVVTVADVLPDVGFGAHIIAGHPIVAERTMRFGPDENGFHTGPGIAKLSQRWYFAEGTTTPPFQMRLLLLNPNDQPANATVTFMTPDGTTLTLKRRYAIPPTTRLVVDANEVVPALGVATVVEADRPIAAERALYFNTDEDQLDPTAGTVSAGATEPAYTWRFVDRGNADAREYILLSNPSRGQASVAIELVLEDGSSETQSIVMPANARYTVAVHEIAADQPVVSLVVRATQKIVAERSIFPEDQGGSTMLGVPLP